MGKGRAPCCEKVGLNKGSWSAEEDMRLVAFIRRYGHGNWRSLPKLAGLLRCGKSCRLRWINYLRPDIKRGSFAREEEDTVIRLHALLGNKWSKIASCLPGRTDNEIKNVWNTHLKKRLASKVGKSDGDASTNSSSSSSSCTSQQYSASNLSEQAKISSSIEAIEIPAEPEGVDMWSMLLEEDDASVTPPPDAHVDVNSSTTSSPVCASPSSSSSQVFAVRGNVREPGKHDVNRDSQNFVMLDADIGPEFWSTIDCGTASPAGTAQGFGWGSSIEMADEAGGEGSERSSGHGGWLEHLEKELGLLGSSYGDHDGLIVGGTDMELEGDPVFSYFQKGSLF